MESSVDIHFPGLEEALAPWRRATVAVATRGVPPHVTLLYPWKPPPLEPEDLRDFARAVAGFRPFALVFTEVRCFPNGTVYLALRDETAPRAITRALAAAFPAYPPYGGAFPDPTPHLTVAKPAPERAAAVRAEVARALPLPFDARVDGLAIMVEDADGWWSVRHRHAL